MSLLNFLSAPLRAIGRLSQDTAATLSGSNRPKSAQHKQPTLKDLQGALHHRSPKIRMDAASRIGAMGIVDAGRSLANVAGDQHPQARRSTLGALLLLDPDLFADTAVKLAGVLPRAELFADLDAVLEGIRRTGDRPEQGTNEPSLGGPS